MAIWQKTLAILAALEKYEGPALEGPTDSVENPTDEEIDLINAWNFLVDHPEWRDDIARVGDVAADDAVKRQQSALSIYRRVADALRGRYTTWCAENQANVEGPIFRGLWAYAFNTGKIFGVHRSWHHWPTVPVRTMPRMVLGGWDDDPFSV